MPLITRHIAPLLLGVGAAIIAATAAAGTQIDLSAEGSRSAPNDLARATVFAEATGPSAAELSRRVNAQIAEGLQLTKKYAALMMRSGSNQTSALYGKNGRIDGWRVRSELIIESKDLPAISEALGKLQNLLNVEQLTLLPAPDTRKQAEDAAIGDAIAAFRGRAKLVADALGKPYRIHKLAVHTQQRPIVPVMRAAMMAEAASMPVEAGEATVGVTVSGQIELVE
jgi:predicted secreted protein